jgi:hypothetical protein
MSNARLRYCHVVLLLAAAFALPTSAQRPWGELLFGYSVHDEASLRKIAQTRFNAMLARPELASTTIIPLDRAALRRQVALTQELGLRWVFHAPGGPTAACGTMWMWDFPPGRGISTYVDGEGRPYHAPCLYDEDYLVWRIQDPMIVAAELRRDYSLVEGIAVDTEAYPTRGSQRGRRDSPWEHSDVPYAYEDYIGYYGPCYCDECWDRGRDRLGLPRVSVRGRGEYLENHADDAGRYRSMQIAHVREVCRRIRAAVDRVHDEVSFGLVQYRATGPPWERGYWEALFTELASDRAPTLIFSGEQYYLAEGRYDDPRSYHIYRKQYEFVRSKAPARLIGGIALPDAARYEGSRPWKLPGQVDAILRVCDGAWVWAFQSLFSSLSGQHGTGWAPNGTWEEYAAQLPKR